MSEELELAANNLCIPEDAFEKFQAVSMYQEEKYIVLPRKEPPTLIPSEPGKNSLTSDDDDVAFNSNIVANNAVNSTQIDVNFEDNPLNRSHVESSIVVDDDTSLSNSTAKTSECSQNTNNLKNQYENDSDNMIVSNSENVNNQIKPGKESSLSYVTPRKRGRKPKKSLVPMEELSAGTSKNIQNPDISSTPLSSDLEISDSVTHTRKKRGRPRKVQPEELIKDKAVNNDKDKELSNVLSGSDNNKSEDLPINQTRRSRRGRQPGRGKKIQEQCLLIENKKEEVQNEQLSSSNETPRKHKRRRISSVETSVNTKLDNSKLQPDSPNKSLSDNIIINDDLDDICLIKLKNDPVQCDISKVVEGTDSDLKDISSESLGQHKKNNKKRGRPKKDNVKNIIVANTELVLDSTGDVEIKDTIEDDADDMCLSKLKTITESSIEECNGKTKLTEKQNSISEVEKDSNDTAVTPNKRNTKMPVMADFEYNIDSVIGNDNTDVFDQYGDNSLLIEDTSKRPSRRKTKKLQYEEESDEDPFANMEVSEDDEPKRGRRSQKYYSDDEYIPGKRGNAAIDSTDTEISENENIIKSDDTKKQKSKKLRKKSDSQSPKKKCKKDDESNQANVDQNQNSGQSDDVILEPSVKPNNSESQPSQLWGTTTEFENFLAKKIQGTSLKIKKVNSGVPTESTKIEIPVINQDSKKTIEMCTQTTSKPTKSVAVQTSTPYDKPLKENLPLTPEQSEKACYFLNSIVKTTAELGLLMTQKSEDFIKKKINTSHVIDTAKMDYCVKKSFLLFKLAKHNLLQMEEDLAKQYDDFLKVNNLTKCREDEKQVLPNAKDANSDSDCEIVDVEPSPQVPANSSQKSQAKPAFNPKTVFLNKELSIKIAKKPNDNKKLDIKGRHTVWINDTILVKKVKPTQSFLAQDSRNKKPPDNCITKEMVSDFFKDYYRQKALSVCAPFVSTDWLNTNKECVCNYFVVKPMQFNAETNYSNADEFSLNNNTEARPSLSAVGSVNINTVVSTPESLFTLCCNLLKIQLFHENLKEVSHKKRNTLTDGKNAPVTLFRLCMEHITKNINKMNGCAIPATHETSKTTIPISALPLKSLCHRRIVALLAESTYSNTEGEKTSNIDNIIYYTEESNDSWLTNYQESIIIPQVPLLHNKRNGIKTLSSLCIEYFQRPQIIINSKTNGIKSLFSMCVEYFQKAQETCEQNNNSIALPKSLKMITYENVKHLMYDSHENDNETGLMINCVNTLTEEAFLNLQQYNADIPDGFEYLDDFDNYENDESDLCDHEDDEAEPSWLPQVQIQELRSCVNLDSLGINEQQDIESTITQIKIEPLDDVTDNILEPILVKTEPGPGLNEMTIIPDIKPELEDNLHAATVQRQNSYDENMYETLVSSTKLLQALTKPNNDEIYSQSSDRVRKQHEPDYYEGNVTDMLGLLVPHAYEPLHIQTAKGSLMESSSDENSKNTKNPSKKVTKRGKGKGKKTEQKVKNKNVPVPAPVTMKEKEKPNNNEVAILTRKMRERIRQEEKDNESTDSETENVSLRLRNREKKDTSDQTRDKSKPVPSTKGKINEIQVNNVDSTEQHEDTDHNFTGFTSIETNEMSNYEKYMKFVYDKVVPDKEKEIEEARAAKKKVKRDNTKPEEKADVVISPHEPVELLECVPTLPFFDDNTVERQPPNATKTKVTKTATPPPIFIDRYSWHCYPVDPNDSKLYDATVILLEKLPESFVQTYFKYQNINIRDESDQEINRLTNLNSLNRSSLVKDRKSQIISKRDVKDEKSENTSDTSRTLSVLDSDHYDELMPSEDDTPNIDDEVLQPVQRQIENTLAKNLLMDDKESDEEGVKIKKEVEDSSYVKEEKTRSKKKNFVEDSLDMMLTADKMMNKELTLLHAPVVMDDQVKDIPAKGPVTRHSKKKSSQPSPTNNKIKNEEDSSSEEEKQWVSTKEKLLKRMGKKESTSADDAKRAKLVSEFIERREGNPNAHKRSSGRSRRSSKKFLEREKQLRVLHRELFGEMSNDPTVSKRSVAAWKGRRNIRKVLDKKSLARSTVIANMEEFERKRRLNSRQTKLRELLGCEEGVNVLVINDEVCLEYDFAEHRPVVTIHPFFTKVMKAHQYEGVKFMWDACFESLADMSAGHLGGGCILAHCMGLGKTLQVLALLHTVLTHPGVGMSRVLVCCPLSTVLNWVDEIHKWIGPVTNQIKVFELSKLKKTYERAYQLEDWYNGGGIFIIGYELFRSLSTLDPLLDDVRPTIVNKIRTALLDPGPDIIVCDEGHLLKNDCSVLAVAMSRVVTKRRIVLTGTPMQNNLREYYCMVNFVKPNLLGTYAEYSNRFENPIMNGQHRDSREEDIKLMKARTHILHKVLEGCLQRQEVSVLYPYLPKKHEYTVFITLTKCQWDLYKHYLNNYSKHLKSNSILKDFHILQKIWSHPQVLHNFQIKAQDNKNKIKLEKIEDDLATEDQEDIKDNVATEKWWLEYLDGGDKLDSLETSNKFVVVFRILDECVALGDKVLIFSTSLFCLDALEYFLKKINKWSLGQEYYRLDGSVPAEVRQKWCREFNAENNVNTKLFLVSTRAGCLGLNMTAANRVIIMDTSWNPAHDIQSIFRVYRFGQKKDCFIYRLVAMGTMEQKIYERSVTKQAVACRVVDEQQIDRHYNMAELTELYRYDEAGSGVVPGVAVGVSDVALLRVARDVALHAVHEHDSLLRSSEQGLPEHERAAAWMQFQQEQAHKQMENKLITNIPKIALKRIEGENYQTYIELNDIKPELDIENIKDEISPPAEIKTKRGKKITKFIVETAKPSPNKSIPPPEASPPPAVTLPRAPSPPPDSSSDFSDVNQTYGSANRQGPGTSKAVKKVTNTKDTEEEEMIHKITQILIDHNFESRKDSTEIANLVTKVRKIIKQGYILNEKDTDDVTVNIAKILLPRRLSLPVLTDIMCESINNSVNSLASTNTTENVDSTPIYPNKGKGKYRTKSKRKAALAAEKHIDSISHDIIINLDDEFDPSDADFVPHIEDRPEKAPTSKRKSNSKENNDKDTEIIEKCYKGKGLQNTPVSNLNEKESLLKENTPTTRKVKAGPKTYKEKLQQRNEAPTPKATETVPNSIVLSDDDDSSTLQETPPRSPSPTPSTPQPPSVDNDDEIVPLPLSLLTNKNFINIVAHTYLNGNPMLDADAATLAAQYSTFKSLKEAEQTGKDILSGPIYDIAVKVIGKHLFKKMLQTKAQSSVDSDSATVTIELKEKMREMTENKFKSDAKSKTKINTRNQAENCNSMNFEANDTTADQNVVPIGLIQTRESLHDMFTSSECILPDDDDNTHIVPHALPVTRAPGPSSLRAAPTSLLRRIAPDLAKSSVGVTLAPSEPSTDARKSPGFINHSLDYKNNPGRPKNYIKINKGKIVFPTRSVKDVPKTPQQILPSNDTICLDSDEEETITPMTLTPAYPANLNPVPVSLSTDHPTSVQSILSYAASGNSAQTPAPTPLILRQVNSSATQKFMLAPAMKKMTQVLPRLAPKESVTTQSMDPKNTIVSPSPKASIQPTDSSAKILKTRCKPGDIIKILETGEIEILQATQVNTATTSENSLLNTNNPKILTQVPVSKLPAEIVKPKSIGATKNVVSSTDLNVYRNKVKPKVSNNTIKTNIEPLNVNTVTKPSNEPTESKLSSETKSKFGYTDIAKQKPKSQTSSSTAGDKQIGIRQETLRKVSISSSSSSSRPSSPADSNPLSILKNVVHIQAADVSPRTSTTKTNTNTLKSLNNNKVKSQIDKIQTQSSKKPNISVQNSCSKSVLAKTSTKITPKNRLSLVSKDTLKKPKEQPKLKNVENPSIITIEPEKTINMLDIVKNKKSLSLKSRGGDKKRSSSKTSDKSIVVEDRPSSSRTESFACVDLTHFTEVTSGGSANMLKTNAESKKRSCTTETGAPKKKKTEPMTLKDFDIDDIDDIIELD